MFITPAWELDWWKTGPSPHLTWLELDCRDGTPYPEEFRRTKAVLLGLEFEHIRARVADVMHEETPIKVSSGYRTVEWNKKIGGARHSRHPEAEAIDLETPQGLDTPTFWDVVETVARTEGSLIRGLGKYDWGAHIDIRGAVFKPDSVVVNASRLTTWRGHRVKAENPRFLA